MANVFGTLPFHNLNGPKQPKFAQFPKSIFIFTLNLIFSLIWIFYERKVKDLSLTSRVPFPRTIHNFQPANSFYLQKVKVIHSRISEVQLMFQAIEASKIPRKQILKQTSVQGGHQQQSYVIFPNHINPLPTPPDTIQGNLVLLFWTSKFKT